VKNRLNLLPKVVTPELDTSKIDTTADAKTPAVPDAQKRQAKKNSSPAGKSRAWKSLPKSRF